MKFSGVKKISAAAIAAMMLVAGMTACGSSDSTGTADSGATTGTDVKKIGIIQLVEHWIWQEKALLTVWQKPAM